MKLIEFSRSFLTFRIDTLKKPPATVSHEPPFTLNNVRIPIECRCRIIEKASGDSEDFVLGASCKTERVGVDRDVWTHPNADFTPIFSQKQGLLIKTFDHIQRHVAFYPASAGMQPDRQIVLLEEAFDRTSIDLSYVEGELLSSAEQINKAILNNEPMTATTRINTDRYEAVLDYPVKTINANERDNIYQTDTGPVMLPDLSRNSDEMIEGFQLAYSAFSDPGWIEFIVREPVKIAQGVNVYHYNRPERLDAQNQLFRLKRASSYAG
jgi:hypothetical protein